MLLPGLTFLSENMTDNLQSALPSSGGVSNCCFGSQVVAHSTQRNDSLLACCRSTIVVDELAADCQARMVVYYICQGLPAEPR